MSAAPVRPMDRWSRRRAAVQAEQEALEKAEAAARAAREQDEFADKSDEDILRALDLPDPDTLTSEDDFSGFMSAKVPERLRIRALRRLWLSDPTLANVDGLVDYGEDFNVVGAMFEKVQTAYQVGRGFVDRLSEDDSPTAEPATAGEGGNEGGNESGAEPGPVAAANAGEGVTGFAQNGALDETPPAQQTPPAQPTGDGFASRMRFAFPEDTFPDDVISKDAGPTDPDHTPDLDSAT